MTITIGKRTVWVIIILIVTVFATWMVTSMNDNADKMVQYHDCVDRMIDTGAPYSASVAVCQSRYPN